MAEYNNVQVYSGKDLASQQQEAPKANDLGTLIKAQTPGIAKAIGGLTAEERRNRAERFARICATAVRMNPKLAACSHDSFLGAMMTCAQLNLEPNTPQGLAYLIPYFNGRKRQYECQFQVGYKGLMQLMYRSGMVASFNADVVYRGEVETGLFRYESGIRPTIEHKIDLLDDSARTLNPADIVAAYAAVVLKTGEPILRLVTRKDIDAARKLNPSDSPAWNNHYAAMAIKTAIKRLAAWMPQTEIISMAIEKDSVADREMAETSASEEATPAIFIAPELQKPVIEAITEPTQDEKPESPSPSPAPEAPKPEPAPEPAPEQPKAEEKKEEPVAKKKEKAADNAVTPQLKLYKALEEQCDGDIVSMQCLLNTIAGNDKHEIGQIPQFTDFVAERFLNLLEEHLKKLEKAT